MGDEERQKREAEFLARTGKSPEDWAATSGAEALRRRWFKKHTVGTVMMYPSDAPGAPVDNPDIVDEMKAMLDGACVPKEVVASAESGSGYNGRTVPPGCRLIEQKTVPAFTADGQSAVVGTVVIGYPGSDRETAIAAALELCGAPGAGRVRIAQTVTANPSSRVIRVRWADAPPLVNTVRPGDEPDAPFIVEGK